MTTTLTSICAMKVNSFDKKMNFLPKIDLIGNFAHLRCIHDDDDICCVYFVGHDGAVKIGRTTDLKSRMKTIQTSCHAPIELIYSFWTDKQTETELHKVFSDLRLKGEWFRFGEDFVFRLKKYMDTYDKWWNECKSWIDNGGEGTSPVLKITSL